MQLGWRYDLVRADVNHPEKQIDDRMLDQNRVVLEHTLLVKTALQ